VSSSSRAGFFLGGGGGGALAFLGSGAFFWRALSASLNGLLLKASSFFLGGSFFELMGEAFSRV
jgi:hypothetical protein